MDKKIIFIIGIVVLGVLSFFYWQSMSYSKEVLKLEILGPSEVSLGENVEYVVRFKNNGNIRLEDPEMIFEYPDNSIIDGERIQIYSSEDLEGDIYPGQERVFKFDARLLGQEGDIKIAKVTVSFKPKDLNTRNESSTEFITKISSIPIEFDFDLPTKISSKDKALSFDIDYASSVSYTMNDLTIYMSYPLDFEFLYSQPKALDETQWDIPILNQSDRGRIEVSGILNTSSNTQQRFTAKIGIWNNDEFVLLKEITKGVEVVSPSLYITQKVNGSYSYIASPGDVLHYEIFFRNIGDEPLSDLVLVAKLEGDGLNFSSIEAPNGKHEGEDASILFESSAVSELEYLDIDETGMVEFWIAMDPNWTMDSLSDANPRVKDRLSIGQTTEEFITKIGSNLTAEQYIDFSDQYLEDSGPYPLEEDEKTVFTIIWKARNSFNDLENVYMRTVLPENGTFEEEIYPELDSGLSYNSVTRELIWDVGSLSAGSGILDDARMCAFQVSVTPQVLNEEGILILGAAQVSAQDQWTEQTLNYKTEDIQAEVNK